MHSALQLPRRPRQSGCRRCSRPARSDTTAKARRGSQRARMRRGLATVKMRPASLRALSIMSERFRSSRRAQRRPGRMLRNHRNDHRDHILKISRVPAKVTPALEEEGAASPPAGQGLRLCRGHGGGDVRHPKRHRRRLWSTRSLPGCTIPGTGPSTGPRCRNSNSTSGRSPACRWPSPSGLAGVEMST